MRNYKIQIQVLELFLFLAFLGPLPEALAQGGGPVVTTDQKGLTPGTAHLQGGQTVEDHRGSQRQSPELKRLGEGLSRDQQYVDQLKQNNPGMGERGQKLNKKYEERMNAAGVKQSPSSFKKNPQGEFDAANAHQSDLRQRQKQLGKDQENLKRARAGEADKARQGSLDKAIKTNQKLQGHLGNVTNASKAVQSGSSPALGKPPAGSPSFGRGSSASPPMKRGRR